MQSFLSEIGALAGRLGDKLAGWGRELVLMLPNLVAALLIVVVAWLLSRVVGRVLCGLLNQATQMQRSMSDLMYRLVRFAIVAIGFVIALQVLELDKAATTLLAGAGIIGLALGFAFQDLTANFIAGVALAMRRPMRVGDMVETNDLFGRVEAINLRTSWLRQPDGKLVMIPNRKIFEEPLINFSTNGTLRLDVTCGISYGEDLEQVKAIVLAALEPIERDRSRDVEFYYTEFGDSSINFMTRYWIEYRGQKDIHAARSDGVMAIKKAFDQHGITIPFPIRTLNFGIHGGQSLREQLTELMGDRNRRAA